MRLDQALFVCVFVLQDPSSTQGSPSDLVAKSAERRFPERKVGSSNPSQVNPMTYQNDSFPYLA